MEEIADHFVISSPTAHKTLKTLQRKGYIHFGRDKLSGFFIRLIERAVGIVVHFNVGDKVEKGQPLFTVHANDQSELEGAKERLLAAHTWSDELAEPLPLFYGIVK